MKKTFLGTISLLILILSIGVACTTTTSTHKSKEVTAVASFTATSTAQNATESGPSLHDLKTIDELKEQFNKDFGKTRLILLFSPT